jgi:hypothetical protein
MLFLRPRCAEGMGEAVTSVRCKQMLVKISKGRYFLGDLDVGMRIVFR